MEKNIEQKTELNNNQENNGAVVELVKILQVVKTNTEEAKLNKTSMQDAFGRRILF